MLAHEPLISLRTMSFKDFVNDPQHGVVAAINVFIVPLLFGLAFAAFVWGILQYFFLHNDSEESRRQGRDFALWGVLGMILLFTVWGVVHILLDTLGISPA